MLTTPHAAPPGSRSRRTTGAPTMRLLTAQEAADIIQVSTTTLIRWAKSGAVRSVTIPSGRLRFRITDLPGFEQSG